MESFIIASRDENAALMYTHMLCQEKHIEAIDITTIEQDGPVSPGERASRGGSIGIAEIRNLQKTLFLTPVKSPAKAVLIKHAETLTVEAQNALLKILEEPPPYTIIVLLTESKDLLLPTILSRCKIIELPTNSLRHSGKPKAHPESENEKTKEYTSILVYLESSGIGGKLKLAQDVAKNKEDILPWLENMILSIRQQLLASHMSSGNSKLADVQQVTFLKALQKTYVTLKTTNANPRLLLENIFLAL